MSKQLHYDDETGSNFDYNYAEAYISDEEDAYCDDEHHSNSSLIVLTTSSPIRFHSKHEHLVRCEATASSHHRCQHLPPVSGSRSPAKAAATNPLSLHGSSEAATSTPQKLQPATATSAPPPLPLAAAEVVAVRVHNPYSAEVLLPEHRDLWLDDYNLQYAEELAELDAAAAYDAEDFSMDAGGSAEPLSMCCYFKQFGQCRMARSCWHGHAGFAHTPCHYGVNCRIAEHRAVAKAAEQAAWEAAATAAGEVAGASSLAGATSGGHVARYAPRPHPQEQHAYAASYRHAHARGAGAELAAAFSHPPAHPPAHPHCDGSVASSDTAAGAMPLASQPVAPKHAAPQPSTLVPANFPCAYCDKTGKVMTQEIPIYEGSKVLKTIRVLCGNCLRTYQI